MCDILKINKGDFVTRKSYNHDTLFKVINIKDGIYYLKGILQNKYEYQKYFL